MNDQQRKTFETCRARLFLANVRVHRIDGDFGHAEYVVSEGPMCRRFSDLDQLEAWVDLRCGRREVAA